MVSTEGDVAGEARRRGAYSKGKKRMKRFVNDLINVKLLASCCSRKI